MSCPVSGKSNYFRWLYKLVKCICNAFLAWQIPDKKVCRKKWGRSDFSGSAVAAADTGGFLPKTFSPVGQVAPAGPTSFPWPAWSRWPVATGPASTRLPARQTAASDAASLFRYRPSARGWQTRGKPAPRDS